MNRSPSKSEYRIASTFYIVGASFIGLLCIIGGSTLLLAQPLDSQYVVKEWSLVACLEYAKQHNIQLNSLRLNERSSVENLRLSQAAVMPDLYGSVTQSLRHSRQLTENSGAYVSSFSPAGTYGLSSSWTLYRGGFLRVDKLQKNAQVASANLSILQEENDITLLITQAYLTILLDKERLVYERDVVNTSQAQVDQAKRFLEAGTIAKKDLAQLEAQLANDQYTLVLIQNAQRQDLLTLKQLLQLPPEQSFDVISPDTLLAEAVVEPLRIVEDYASQNRPEIKNGQMAVYIAELDLEKARSGYKPSIVLGTSLGSSYLRNPSYDFFQQLNNDFYQQVGLTLSIPIFTQRINKTNVRLAKINIDQANLTLQDAKIGLSQNVERAYLTVLNGQSQYAAATEAFRYNQETYRIANEQLKVGVADMVEYLQQKNLYIQALQAYIEAKYNATLALKIYNFYNGVSVQ